MNPGLEKILLEPLTDEQKRTIERMMVDLAKAEDPVVKKVLKASPEAARDLCAVVVRLAEAMKLESDPGRARIAQRMGVTPPVRRLIQHEGNKVSYTVASPEEAADLGAVRREQRAAARQRGEQPAYERPARLPPAESAELRRKMGLPRLGSAIFREGNKVSFGVMSVEEAREATRTREQALSEARRRLYARTNGE